MFQPSVRELLFICKLNKMCLQCHQAFLQFCISVLWRCWLGDRKGIRPVKNFSGGMLEWLSVWSEVQTCIWPSWCHCHSLSLALVKSRLVLPFLYWLTPCSPGQRAVKRVCVCVCVLIRLAHEIWWCMFVCVHQLLVCSTWPSLLRSTL